MGLPCVLFGSLVLFFHLYTIFYRSKKKKKKWDYPMKLYCDNKSAINIAHNPIQHDRTKHIEVERQFIKEKLEEGVVCMSYVPS